MKKQTSLFFLLVVLLATNVSAQSKSSENNEIPVDISVINAELDMFKSNVTNELQITDLGVAQFDRISVLDKKGKSLIRKNVNAASIAHIDVSHLDEGVYLMTLIASSTRIEKTIKFIINR